MARIIWKENDLVSLKLKDDLYTIGQLLDRPEMRFYNIKSIEDKWENIDLNDYEPLFKVYVGSKDVLPKLATGKIKNKTVKPDLKKYEKESYWLRGIDNDGSYLRGEFLKKNANLVFTEPGKDYWDAPIVKENINAKNNLDIVIEYEMVNMYGADDLQERLITFFETGVNINTYKFKVFPDLTLEAVKKYQLKKK